ncbi:3-hydroxydecanoyl-ACP dehydratase [Vibrio sp. HA2012]|uniref:hotdog family protein n=1 Tax=Vibrio sp. HA2012 TaxID=1971595 RepID=UPI000C2BEE8B|nr:hotdog family protein [Vibrio sp. HA2012]PJC85976.1 3-hydroxydecanoyl-ACP dehydratase [Vibrio sp. HA2012]
MEKLPEVKDLLPHDEPMVLLNRVISVEEISIHCQADVTEANLFFDHEKRVIPAYVGIEYMAQSIAAWSGYHARKRQESPPIGFLLGSRRYNTELGAFHENMVLDIFAEQVMEDSGMAVFSGRIEHNGTLIAQCQLNVYVPDEDKLQEMKKG